MPLMHRDADDLTAPADYDTLWRVYGNFTKKIVRQYGGIPASSVDDVAQDVFIRLMQNDVLERYDPTRTFLVRGVARPCKFRTYLAKTVRQHLRGFAEREQRNIWREVCLIDTPMTGPTDDGTGFAWLDHDVAHAVASPEDGVVDTVDGLVDRAEARAFLATWPKRTTADSLNLPEFFDAVCLQADDVQEFRAEPLARKFQVALTTVHTWRFELRKALWHFYTGHIGMEMPYPTRRPRSAKSKNQLGG